MSFYWIQHNWSTLGITHVKQEISTMQDNGILSSQSFVSQIILSVIYFFLSAFVAWCVIHLPKLSPPTTHQQPSLFLAKREVYFHILRHEI